MAKSESYTVVEDSVQRSGVPILDHPHCTSYAQAIQVVQGSPTTGCVLAELNYAIAVLFIHAAGTRHAKRDEETMAFYQKLEPQLQRDFGNNRVSRFTHDGVAGIAVLHR